MPKTLYIVRIMTYTNTNLDLIGELYGIPILPCVKSGFCCTKSPCAFGKMKEDRTSCIHLDEPNELGQRNCLRYDDIKANNPGYMFHPAFGAGCSSTLFNEDRERVIDNIKKLNGNVTSPGE